MIRAEVIRKRLDKLDEYLAILHDVNGFRCGSMSESSVLDAIELLRQEGTDVRYHDPYVPSIRYNAFEIAGEPAPEAALRLRSGQGIGCGGLLGVDGSFVL